MDNKPQRKLHTERIPAVLVMLLSIIGGPAIFYFGASTHSTFFTWCGIVIVFGGVLLGYIMLSRVMQKTMNAKQWSAKKML
jgi:uncharacterized protein (DUF983 family)